MAGTGTATAANGVATKTLTGSLAGTVTIAASAPLLTSDSLGFSVIPGAGDHLVVHERDDQPHLGRRPHAHRRDP